MANATSDISNTINQEQEQPAIPKIRPQKRGRPKKGEIRDPLTADIKTIYYHNKYKHLKILGEYIQQLIEQGKFVDPGPLVRIRREEGSKKGYIILPKKQLQNPSVNLAPPQ